MGIRVTVRDGRVGRDASLVTEEGGEILAVLDLAQPIDVGYRITLPDASVVEVIGLEENISDKGWHTTAFVGTPPEAQAPGA